VLGLPPFFRRHSSAEAPSWRVGATIDGLGNASAWYGPFLKKGPYQADAFIQPIMASMVLASHLRAGLAIRHEGQLYKVLVAVYHPGQGKMGGACHCRLRNLGTGTLWEHSFRSDLRLEDVPLGKEPMDYLYADAAGHCFMNPETFEQVTIPASLIGEQAQLLQAQMRVHVESVEGNPVSVVFPDVLDVRIADTSPPVHAQQDSNWKTAKLETGVQIMVPQFIKVGDMIRLDVANLKYMERAKGANK